VRAYFIQDQHGISQAVTSGWVDLEDWTVVDECFSGDGIPAERPLMLTTLIMMASKKI